MKRLVRVSLFAALAVAPLAAEAQVRPGAQHQQGERPLAPFALILEERAQLGLTAEQVARIEAIQQRLQAQNAPLLEQLRASGAWEGMRGTVMRPEQRERMRQQMQERQRNLTPEQREQMRRQMRERMQDRQRALRPEQREEMRQRMQERRQAPEGTARGGRQITAELRPVLQQVRANQQAARQEVMSVLTSEQQARLRELAQARRGGDRGQRGPGGRPVR